MSIAGLRNTADWQADQRPKDWLETILLLWPSTKQQAPLTALRAVMKKKVSTDPEFSWFEKKFDDQRPVIDVAIPDGVATNIGVASSLGLRKDMVLLLEETGELVRLSAEPPDADNITVERGVAGSTAAALNIATPGVNPNMLVIGTAHEEGSAAPTAQSRNPVKRNNYTQIFRNTLGMTRTAKQTKLRTGQQIAESKREALEYHTVEMERASFWGHGAEDLSGAEPRRYTQGVINFIDDNSPADQIVDWDADFVTHDMTDFETMLERFFRYGSTEKVAFMGNRALLNLQTLVRLSSDYNIEKGEKEFGISVMRLITAFGTLVLKAHPLFNRVTSGTSGGTAYAGWDAGMVIMDMDNVVWRPLQGSDTQFESNLESNGLDGMLSGYITEGGYEWHHPDTFGYVKNFNIAA